MKLHPADPDFASRVRPSFARQGAMKLIGAELTTVEPGHVVIELPYRAHLTQQHGFIHGGMTAMVADSAAGYAAFTLFPADSSILTVECRRAERRQVGVEVVGSGVLALAAPAAYWVGVGYPNPLGWWLFLLTWFQSAASIVYAYLRLDQRQLRQIPDRQVLLRMARRALLYTSFNFVAVLILGIASVLPKLLFLPFALQWVETLYGTFNPAIGYKPTTIGIRQLIVSTLFTILFIFTWNI